MFYVTHVRVTAIVQCMPDHASTPLDHGQHVGVVPEQPIAKAAEILIRGLARLAITALIDEATGYQEVRARDELQKILELYIQAELRPCRARPSGVDVDHEREARLQSYLNVAGGQYAPPMVAPAPAPAPPPPPAQTMAPNWHPDPSGRHQLRYHDGTAWTAHVSDDGTTGSAPI